MNATLNENHLRDPHSMRDKPRNKSLVKMRIENRSTSNLNVMCNTVGPGQHEIEVYEDEVAKVKAMVEPAPDEIKGAERAYRMALAEKVRGQLSDFPGTNEDVLAIIESRKHDKTALQAKQLWETALETEPLSVQRSFRERVGRDMLPLVSAELVPNSTHAEPQREAAARDHTNMIAAVVATLQTMQGNTEAPAATKK